MKILGKSVLYENLREVVDPEHTAVVVWDIHRDFVNTAFNKKEFVPNLKLFIETARKNKIPIIYTKQVPLPRDYESGWRIYMLMKRLGVDSPEKLPPFLPPGSPEAEIPSELSPRGDDVVIDKHSLSIFIGTHFERMMRNKGINTLLFTGLKTEIGIDSSARDAAARYFYTVVVEDCVSTDDKVLHESSIRTLRRVCLVIPSTDIMKEWKR